MIYLVIAYRWGHTNDHWYFVYAGEDRGKALALAENERDGRGGKYGVAVHEAVDQGERLELRAYFGPSRDDDSEPTHNYRVDYFERLGHVLDDLVSGHLSVPNAEPDARGIRGMHYVQIDVDPVLRAEVERHRHQCQAIQNAMEQARREAAERAERIWCPVCDNAPVYVVEYSNSFWRVPRDESSGEMMVDGLQGNWCRTCEAMHLTPDQISSNWGKICMARSKLETA